MSEGNNLDFGLHFTVYNGVRKTTKRQASRTAFGRHARDRRAETRMVLDQLQGVLNLSEKLPAKSGLFLFVPRNNRSSLRAASSTRMGLLTCARFRL